LRRAAFAIAAGSYPEAEARRNAAEFTPPIVQIPVGVETSRFRPIAPSARETVRARFGVSATSFSIASYSRLVPRKGMDTLIRAAAILRDEIPELTVSIGGSGRDRARLERLARRLHAPVTFVGRVSDEDLSDWLASSDVMVMDCRSRWLGLEQEGFGIVFLEAAAAGIPQIAGRSGGSHEAVRDGETGLVVDNPRSVKALAAAIRSMHADSDRRVVMGERARFVAEEFYDWNILATELGRQLSPFDSPVSSAVIAVEVGE
jgi:phosphatidylinositol alpha-1,6-mannosyltransferase